MKKGKSIISYMESIDVQLVEIQMTYLLSIRKNVLEHEFSEEYGACFGKLFRKMEEKKLTAAAPPMVMFHGDEYTWILYRILQLSFVYAKQIEWAEREGFDDQIKIEELEQKISSKYGNTTGIVIIKDGIICYEKTLKVVQLIAVFTFIL